MKIAEANRFNILDKPYFFDGTQALLSKTERKDFLKRYKFNIVPATDDRPYFFHFFKYLGPSSDGLWTLKLSLKFF